MGIYDPVEKTAIQARAEFIREQSRRVLNGEKNRCEASFVAFWGGLSIEECRELIDEIGHVDFVQALQIHGAWQQFITMADPSYKPLVPPFDISVSDDGVVTLSEVNDG